jgi:MoxR-like ATPase
MKGLPKPDAEEAVRETAAFVDRLTAEVALTIVGQRTMVDRLVLGLLTGGHVLIEGLPGLAKTLVVRTLASALDLTFRRVQFTPDLLPADIIGTLIYNLHESAFRVHKGPIFANIVLADEINRAPAKVQSALLEAMQEGQVTIGSTSYILEEPFMVLATQNPLEQEGTYPLPEAQRDRFLFCVRVDYPARDEEREILRRQLRGPARQTRAVVTWADVLAARVAIAGIFMDERIESYILDLVRATRQVTDPAGTHAPASIRFGASPRAGVHLALAARALAFLNRRAFVLPEDVREVLPDVLRHRLVLSYDAEAEGMTTDRVIAGILATVAVP